MLNRGSTEDFLMLTLQVHLFSKFPFGALTLKHGRQTKLVCLKKKNRLTMVFLCHGGSILC